MYMQPLKSFFGQAELTSHRSSLDGWMRNQSNLIKKSTQLYKTYIICSVKSVYTVPKINDS